MKFALKVTALSFLFFLLPIVVLPVLLVFWRNTAVNCRFLRVFSRIGAWIAGFDVEYQNAEALKKAEPCIILANHQSALDFLTFPQGSPRKAAAVGKKSIGWVPIFGWYFVAAGNILIDRKNSGSAYQTLEKARKAIQEDGVSIAILPEGTRNVQNPEKLLPFKRGAFHLACHAGIPVLPIVCSTLRNAYDPVRKRFPGGRVIVRALDLARPAGNADADVENLKLSVQNQMQKVLDELNALR